MPVITAVRASAAIPLYYRAMLLDSAGNIVDKPKDNSNYDVYVDGGLLDNYPLTIFKDGNTDSISQYSLGLKLERPEQIDYYKNADGIAPYNINTFGSYLAALYNMVLEQLNKSLTHEEEKKHTIYISTGNIGPKIRHLGVDQKKLLYTNGYDAAKQFLKKTE
jgi:NTE family protein